MQQTRLSLLMQLADQADQIAMSFFQKQLDIQIKPDQSPVSQADLAIETMVRDEIKTRAPDITVYGEEFENTNPNASIKLIIDPIDGTRNFIRQIPLFATLLAIEEAGVITAGVVSAPASHDRWWASINQGAFHNNRPIHVSQISQLAEAQAFHGSLYGNEASQIPPSLTTLLSKTARQRGVGDYYAPMLVAMGCGEFACDFGIKVWDIAPIKIIIEESGGKFSDLTGAATVYSGNMIVSNGKLHSEILNILQ